MNRKKISIIGGGPSALFFAAFLNTEMYDVTIYEKNKSLGRKFLVAGKGGFNLTHSESMDLFVKRYTPNDFLKQSLHEFTNKHLIDWLKEIGIPTYTGSSKRVFPKKGIKPIEVLNKIITVLKAKKVNIKLEHTWTGWNEKGELIFNSENSVSSDYIVFSLGGGSWKVTGSNRKWLSLFNDKGIETLPFRSSNCGYKIKWASNFITQNEGEPLKNISITCDSKTQKGEVVITSFGLEGNAIYALSPQIQKQLSLHNEANIYLDLKPTLSEEEVLHRMQVSREKNITNKLQNSLKLSKTQIKLIKTNTKKEDFLNPQVLANKIKKLLLVVTEAAPLDEAISTTGGITLNSVHHHFELKQLKNNFCIGEMLDWNAPTGGYLLQACCSMGVYLARHFNSISN